MAAPRNDNIRDKILDAASQLLREKPDVSLAEVASAAGVSKGTLYYHYKSKTELYLDIGERYWNELSDRLIAWVDNPDKDTSLPRLVRYTLRFDVFDESGPIRLHLFSDAMGSESAEVRDALIRQYAHFRDILRARIQKRRPGADGESLAWLLLTLSDGLMVQHALKNDAIDIPETIEFFTKLL